MTEHAERKIGNYQDQGLRRCSCKLIHEWDSPPRCRTPTHHSVNQSNVNAENWHRSCRMCSRSSEHAVAKYLYISVTHSLVHNTTRLERVFSFRLPPRTEDRSVPVVIPWCDLTMYCALSARPSLSADLSPCTGCYKLILLTLYGGPGAAVQ